ncbi:hypothetical protein [Litoribrevibacter albus]|uniref:nicotinate-nucleotide adenylyltransferase n=1 Tax=Litoribrevibacter albus TaxID=1473156 RepID=A0AA37S8Q4_9GAMM|nr:hypothetical protein [Litoribrevibacter albus]GLQ31267.1 nicotinate-nicotinamide nucleotide adenylyltransferase [Litoribrevibacter albus]
MIGIFGSAFNPPTLGHKNAIIQASRSCQTILLVPSASHAFGKQMLPFELRYRMLLGFVHDIQSQIPCPIDVSDIEQQMFHEGFSPIYTFDVLARLEKELGTSELAFIMGPDNANPETWQKFYKHQEIDQRWNKILCEEQQPIRSTRLRQTVAEGATDDRLLNFTTASVVDVIRSEGLYLDAPLSTDN